MNEFSLRMCQHNAQVRLRSYFQLLTNNHQANNAIMSTPKRLAFHANTIQQKKKTSLLQTINQYNVAHFDRHNNQLYLELYLKDIVRVMSLFVTVDLV